MPNSPVDVNSWEESACYPQGSFCPISDGPSTRDRLITKPDFRPCSACKPRSQALFCFYAQRMISNHTESTFGRLRYSLGGDRPSQTTRLTLSHTACAVLVRTAKHQEWYPNDDSIKTEVLISKSPTYPVHDNSMFNIKL